LTETSNLRIALAGIAYLSWSVNVICLWLVSLKTVLKPQ